MAFSPLSLRSVQGVPLSFEGIERIEGVVRPLQDPETLCAHMRDKTRHLVKCKDEEDLTQTVQALLDYSGAKMDELCWIYPSLQKAENASLYRGLVRVEFGLPAAKIVRFINCSGFFFPAGPWKSENEKNLWTSFTTTSFASKEQMLRIVLVATSKLKGRFLNSKVEEIREETIGPLKEEERKSEELDPTPPLSQV